MVRVFWRGSEGPHELTVPPWVSLSLSGVERRSRTAEGTFSGPSYSLQNMDVAKHVPGDRVYTAQVFGALPALTIEKYRRELVCDECGAPAYFTAKRSNGNSFFFGARPHEVGCELATTRTVDTESADLFEAARRESEDGIIRIVPDRLKIETSERLEHDPSAKPHEGIARRYTQTHDGTKTVGSIQMNRLLRRLVRDETFAASDERIWIEDTRTTVREHCVELNQINDTHLKRRRLYWGTVIFYEPTADGGAWLHTAKGLPSVRLTKDVLEMTLALAKSNGDEDLAGASFLVWTWFSPPLKKPEARPFLMAKEASRFTLRLASQDPDF